MSLYRRFAALAPVVLSLALAACGQSPTQSVMQAPAAEARPEPRVWFICDALNQPVVLVARRLEGENGATITRYAKNAAVQPQPTHYELGEGDGAAGSIYTPLLTNGVQAGAIRTINAGMLEDPAGAYTLVITELRLGDETFNCRWMERTRVLAISTRRTFVISDDADGDLIYRTYDFASEARPVDLGAQRTTTFSLEVRGGEEETTPARTRFTFTNNGYRYVVTVPNTGAATVVVQQGERTVQTETLLAAQTGPTDQE